MYALLRPHCPRHHVAFKCRSRSIQASRNVPQILVTLSSLRVQSASVQEPSLESYAPSGLKLPPPHGIAMQTLTLHAGVKESMQFAEVGHVVTTATVVTMVSPVKGMVKDIAVGSSTGAVDTHEGFDHCDADLVLVRTVLEEPDWWMTRPYRGYFPGHFQSRRWSVESPLVLTSVFLNHWHACPGCPPVSAHEETREESAVGRGVLNQHQRGVARGDAASVNESLGAGCHVRGRTASNMRCRPGCPPDTSECRCKGQ